MTDKILFTAKIEKSAGKGGWHYVSLTGDVRHKLRELSGKNGNVPVLMTIGASMWPSTTMSMGEQRWFVAVKADVRKSENITEGDTVSVNIAPDFYRIKQ